MRIIVFSSLLVLTQLAFGQTISFDSFNYIKDEKKIEHKNVSSTLKISESSKTIDFQVNQKGSIIRMNFSILKTHKWYPEEGLTQIEYTVRFNGKGGELGNLLLVLMKPKGDLKNSLFSIVEGDGGQSLYFNDL